MPPTTIHVRPTGVPDETTPGIETRDLARLFRVRRRCRRDRARRGRPRGGRAGRQRGGQDDPPAHPGHRPASLVRDGAGGRHRRRPAPRRRSVRGSALLPATGLYDDLTAAENLGFAAALLRIPSPDRAGRIAAALDRVELGRPAMTGSAASRPACAADWRWVGSCSATPPRPARRAVRGPRRRGPDPGRRSARRVAGERGHRPGRDPRRRSVGPRIDGWMRLEHGLLVEVGGAGVDGRTATVGRHRGRHRPRERRCPRAHAVRAFVQHLSVAVVIAAKDLRAELRGRQAVTSTLFLAAVTMLVFGFALGPDRDRLAAAGPASCGWPSSSAGCWPSAGCTTSRRRTARSSCSACIPSAGPRLPRQGARRPGGHARPGRAGPAADGHPVRGRRRRRPSLA